MLTNPQIPISGKSATALYDARAAQNAVEPLRPC